MAWKSSKYYEKAIWWTKDQDYGGHQRFDTLEDARKDAEKDKRQGYGDGVKT
jgi:hypothetical protein